MFQPKFLSIFALLVALSCTLPQGGDGSDAFDDLFGHDLFGPILAGASTLVNNDDMADDGDSLIYALSQFTDSLSGMQASIGGMMGCMSGTMDSWKDLQSSLGGLGDAVTDLTTDLVIACKGALGTILDGYTQMFGDLDIFRDFLANILSIFSDSSLGDVLINLFQGLSDISQGLDLDGTLSGLFGALGGSGAGAGAGSGGNGGSGAGAGSGGNGGSGAGAGAGSGGNGGANYYNGYYYKDYYGAGSGSGGSGGSSGAGASSRSGGNGGGNGGVAGSGGNGDYYGNDYYYKYYYGDDTGYYDDSGSSGGSGAQAVSRK